MSNKSRKGGEKGGFFLSYRSPIPLMTWVVHSSCLCFWVMGGRYNLINEVDDLWINGLVGCDLCRCDGEREGRGLYLIDDSAFDGCMMGYLMS
jgi:hypothetical protein